MAQLNNKIILDAESAKTLQLLGFIQSQKLDTAVDKRTARGSRVASFGASSKLSDRGRDSESNSRTGNTGARESVAKGKGNINSGLAMAAKQIAGLTGIPYAGLATGLAINAINNEPQKNIGLGVNALLSAVNPVLGLVSGQLSVPEMVMSMAEFGTTPSEAFSAANPKMAKALDINQADKEKNQEALDRAIEVGKLAGWDTSTPEGRYEAAMAGFSALGNTEKDSGASSDNSVDRDQDPSKNTSSMSDKDI